MCFTLDTDVRAALIARKGEWRAIAATCDVSYSWISKFVNDHIPNPGYGTLKALGVHLGVPACALSLEPEALHAATWPEIDRRHPENAGEWIAPRRRATDPPHLVALEHAPLGQAPESHDGNA